MCFGTCRAVSNWPSIPVRLYWTVLQAVQCASAGITLVTETIAPLKQTKDEALQVFW